MQGRGRNGVYILCLRLFLAPFPECLLFERAGSSHGSSQGAPTIPLGSWHIRGTLCFHQCFLARRNHQKRHP